MEWLFSCADFIEAITAAHGSGLPGLEPDYGLLSNSGDPVRKSGELSQLLGEQISPYDKEAVISGAKRLKERGARNVLVSLASQGALLLTEDDRVISREAPNGIVRNSVGSGDSMVAGFIAGYLESGSLEDAFYMGLAAGSATAFMEGLAGGQEIRELYRFIR